MSSPETIHTDFHGEMNYATYLHLDTLLSSQAPLSGQHDEMLFIVVHQTTELWMKLIWHELQAATHSIQSQDLEPAFKMLARVSRIQSQLIQSWDVLSTLTPADYMAFRAVLGHASGFQSYQNRLIEFAYGYKDSKVLAVFAHEPALHQQLTEALNTPSIYDAAIGALAGRGFAIAPGCLERDWTLNYAPHPSVEQAWLEVYRNVDRYWDLYELAEKLVDIEDHHQQWRFHHVETVERIIGRKSGTGGSSGVNYLQNRLAVRFFPELWSLRTHL